MNEESPEYSRERPERSELEQNLRSRSTWLRLVFMVVFVVFYAVSRIVVSVVVVVQFLHVLFTGKTNQPLQTLGLSLAIYTYQILRYLTFNTEVRPFPFDAEWPGMPPAE
jgi:hypothetical protein